MTRILFLTNVPTPYRIPFLNALSSELASRGAILQVAYCAERERHRAWAIDLTTQRFEWAVLPGVHPRIGPATAHFNPGIASMLRRHPPDVMLAAGAWNTPTVLFASALCRSRCPRVFWSEGHADGVLNRNGPIAAARRTALTLGFDAFAVPNARSEAFVRSEVGHAVPVLRLPNCVDQEIFSAPASEPRSAVRARHGIPSDRRVAVTVARLIRLKGVHRLVRSYLALPGAAQRALSLVFVGSGPLESELTNIVRASRDASVHFLGECEPPTVRDVLAAGDVFILPSERDNNPLSAIEAAFTGLPLFLSSRAGNCQDLVVAGHSGYAFDPLHDSALRDILLLIAQASPALLREMGDNARDIALKDYSTSLVAKRLCDQLYALTL